MAERPIRVGIIGAGTVGGGTVAVLQQHAAEIAARLGRALELAKVADVDWDRPRPVDVPAAQRTTDPYAIINDPSIDIVVEAIGGIDPARELVLAALRAGKSVVTPNKELIARHGQELLEEAARQSVDLSFEGAVGGGIPIIRPLKESLAGNHLYRILGIVNGTTNYILSEMSSAGTPFADVLKEAQRAGYAEADPTNDVEGIDATYKLAILASIAFNSRVRPEDVYREGISRISPTDIRYARELGYVIKLLAIAADTDDGIELRVHPAFLPVTHPLAAVTGVFNAIFVQGDPVGDVMFYGRGAGAGPTGSAIVGDIIATARNIMHGATGRLPCTCVAVKPAKAMDLVECRYYVRMAVTDHPGVLAAIARVFGEEGVSLASVVQKEMTGATAEITWITHAVQEQKLRRALERIGALDVVAEIANCIRVEGESDGAAL
jgi:homoserine dehydrogenase